MKKSIALGFTVLMASFTFGEAMPCETLKAKIEEGFKAKGVQNYTLNIVGTAETADGKQVGTCDGGTKKIMYSREGAAPSSEKPAVKPVSEKKPTAAK